MSVRLYIGNLPQNVNVKELEALLTSIGDGIKFKAVFDRDTKACRGFGFANVKDENVSNELIEKFKDQLPILGICLGHQILARACDISTYKLHNGHRGIKIMK